jgi:hypothetical protein
MKKEQQLKPAEGQKGQRNDVQSLRSAPKVTKAWKPSEKLPSEVKIQRRRKYRPSAGAKEILDRTGGEKCRCGAPAVIVTYAENRHGVKQRVKQCVSCYAENGAGKW